MEKIYKRSLITLFLLLCVLISMYGAFEWMVYQKTPTPANKELLAQQAVNTAKQKFEQVLFSFSNQSAEAAAQIEKLVKSGTQAEEIYRKITTDYSYWGLIVYRDETPLFWDGFVPDAYPNQIPRNSESNILTVGNANNVSFLYSIIPFFNTENENVSRYDVITSVKISQENILELGKDLEQDPSLTFGNTKSYPIKISLNNASESDIIYSESISTISSDSVLTFYALESGYEQYIKSFKDRVSLQRGFFYVGFLLLSGLLILVFARSVGGVLGVVLQLVAYTTVWFLIRNIYPIIETGYEFSLLPEIEILRYFVNSIFALLICVSILPYLINHKEKFKVQDPGKLFLIGIIVSLIAALGFRTFFIQSFELMVQTNLQIMDLELLPDWRTLLLYISASLFFASLAVLNGGLIWFILPKFRRIFWYTISGLVTGFLLTDLFYRFIIPVHNDFTWILLINALLFSIILTFSVFIYQRNPTFLYSSKLRLLLFLGYITVCFTYIPLSNGNVHRLNNRMQEKAFSFKEDEENDIENITRSILRELEKRIKGQSDQLINDMDLARHMEEITQSDWLRYTISVQLINRTGDQFADYTTSLSPPQWSTEFRIDELVIPFEEERITKENLRPVIRNRPINTISSNFSTFRRGWIPVFENDSSEVRTGWILCSVYKEVPQIDRPLRAVIIASESSNWDKTLVTTEYQNGVALRSSISGIPLEISTPTFLPDNLRNIVKADSIHRTSTNYGAEKVKELYTWQPPDKIIRVATSSIGITEHVFAFLRFFFVLIILGVLFLISVSWKKSWHIFGSSRRFRDRLIDRFILASLVCLVALVGASYSVLNAQNRDDVEDGLFERLGNLVLNLQESTQANPESTVDPAILQEITSILDVDAALYKDGFLINSTTSQIFNQHLLPKTIPWDIYSRITKKETSDDVRIVTLDNQDMMIGYEPWLNANNEIEGIAAIPTFLKAPKFYDRLLSTTSYLLASFTLIFGVLMLAVGFISSSLTSPLDDLREGLKRISDGDLETNLPVRGNDEIATLTRAYNVMGSRLKKVQNELAQTEREEAWKEMARQVAHEIKNPLTPMKLNLQHLDRQLQQSGNDPEKIKERVGKITNSMIEQIEALSKIASDFSKFAKPIEQEFQPVEVNKLISSVSEFYLQDESITLTVDLSEKPLMVQGVKEELRRVLVNLIKNAKEATGSGGKISLHTFTDARNKYVFVEVTDNGEGIPKEDQDRIFVPNFSTKTSGTGLGLAISKKIIEEHDGEITFISTLGQGTSFTLRLPFNNRA